MNDISVGMGLLFDNEVYTIIEYRHVKPGKGGAFVRAKLKNFKTDLVIERTFKPADKLQNVFLEEREVQFLYRAGDSFHFMDQSTFEEMVISEKALGDSIRFLQENITVTAVLYNNQIQKVVLPMFIIADIIETEPGFKGDSARAGTKPATIDTGTVVYVPLFINKDDKVKIDTRTGQYVERVQR